MNIFTRKRVVIAVAVLAAVAVAVAVVKRKDDAVPPSQYRSTVVDRGAINQTVTATGTINPVALINVGSQVSGTVAELNADFNDRVKKGQVLLKLEPTIFNAQVRQAEANIASARASLRLAQATFERNEQLVAQNFLSGLALDQSKREMQVAQANLTLAQAQHDRARADLNNSVIRSPIDGVVIKRTIDLGQTLAASFNTPNLFQIAQDLTKMQIDTSVSEADVGQLKDGLPARFVVDAYPDREFAATMRQFRLAPNVVQNVVTYNVVLDVDNVDELLKPGMTAQVRLVVANRPDVLRIPTTALRFRLSEEEQEAERKRNKDAKPGAVAPTPAPVKDDDVAFRSASDTTRMFKIYKLDAMNHPQPVDIRAGLSNFRYTEVVSGDLKAGDRVVTRSLVTPENP
ncbi:MAG: efflux RND transporter periplasmic adaptor subunit [Massilia sp.]|jgi:HlyD family secretion protein|uniref:efflux RND transporter periplasmic adaptor subunit n=1 Tax=Massilia sp. TaxID=1882437 RepID=UPI0019C20AEC|nr:efflux RND transporter periplasmic adaptor subunit [Oxalobacteraceae sp. CFBP 8761]MBD8626164.1 efflux RND transporter periplasmic adaptor subunit [Oxalobacteraceae sp. CFBP 8753]MBD8724064.1 efflux RND transporter periplasmic adaptor subunit [Oxalobacteraceae sp. CFBP 13708]